MGLYFKWNHYLSLKRERFILMIENDFRFSRNREHDIGKEPIEQESTKRVPLFRLTRVERLRFWRTYFDVIDNLVTSIILMLFWLQICKSYAFFSGSSYTIELRSFLNEEKKRFTSNLAIPLLTKRLSNKEYRCLMRIYIMSNTNRKVVMMVKPNCGLTRGRAGSMYRYGISDNGALYC